MQIKSFKALFMFAAGMLILLAPEALKAQIGPNSLQWGVGSATVTNGSTSGSNVTYAKGASIYFGLALRGVSGNGGSTSYHCSFINAATGAVAYMPYSGSTTTDIQFNGGPITLNPGTYNSYCSATWTGNYANGTVSTPFIQVTVQP